MIAFNLTLLVQIIHFVIVYRLLTRVIFDPVVDALVKQKIDERRLLEEISLKHTDVTKFQEEKVSQILQFQQDVRVKLADDTVHITLDPHSTSAVQLTPLTEAEVAVIRRRLQESLYAGH